MASSKKVWLRYLQEEIDASYLYQVLERITPPGNERESYAQMRHIEERHAAGWSKLIDENNISGYNKRPSTKAKLMAFFARIAGKNWLRELMLRQEGNEVKGYLQLYNRAQDERTKSIAITLARDSAGHAASLSNLRGTKGEPWHQAGSGGIIRNIVYGFNDGLTANFGLIAGVIGAQTHDHFILVSGIAGMIADALSMGASGYLAAKSEREVYEYEMGMEAAEIKLMPDLELEELTLIYRSKGMDQNTARMAAAELMKDPAKALEEQALEELGIGHSAISPLREAWLTGLATAIGAFIPVFPFLFWSGATATIAAFLLAMSAHFAVGAARSFFTGRSLWKSGLEMFTVGFGVAVAGYFIGDRITK